MNKIDIGKEQYSEYLKNLLEKGELTEFAKEKSKEIGPKIINFRNELHENPEIGGQEIETTKRIKRELEKLENVEILGEVVPVKKDEKEIGRAGIIARIKGKEKGPTIALRADIDALPIKENPAHPHTSRIEGMMHGCGHDVHTAGLIGGAEILNELAKEGKLDGNVILIFQPSEERTVDKQSGAVKMIRWLEKQGVRKDIDAVFGFHVLAELERETVKVMEGVQSASSGDFEVTLKAPGGHVMDVYKLPNINEILAAIITDINQEFGYQMSQPEPKDVLVSSASTHFVGKAGYNILAKEGGSEWVLRVRSVDYNTKRKEALEKIRQIVKERTEPWEKAGLSTEFKFNPGYRPLVHRHPEIVNLSRQIAKEVIGSQIKFDESPMMGGEDFAFYLEKLREKEIPGTFVMVGAANPEKGIPLCSHHQPNFRIDEEVIPELAALHTQFIIKAIEHFKKKEGSK